MSSCMTACLLPPLPPLPPKPPPAKRRRLLSPLHPPRLPDQQQHQAQNSQEQAQYELVVSLTDFDISKVGRFLLAGRCCAWRSFEPRLCR